MNSVYFYHGFVITFCTHYRVNSTSDFSNDSASAHRLIGSTVSADANEDNTMYFNIIKPKIWNTRLKNQTFDKYLTTYVYLYREAYVTAHFPICVFLQFTLNFKPKERLNFVTISDL